MTGKPRILLIEDDDGDYVIVRDMLEEVCRGGFTLDRAGTWDEALAAIGGGGHDACVLDDGLGGRSGIELVREAVARGCRAPIILLTGEASREIDLEAMRAGAADYLVKGEITAPLLERSIRYAIERHRGERRLSELARYDQLTGLANRALFREFLAATLARADRLRRAVAVMFLDLNRFKAINDTYGHDAGDRLLRQVAGRLRDCVRAGDLVARLGGDEFTVVVDGIMDPEVIAHSGERILRAVREPIKLGAGRRVQVSASIGIAIYPLDADDIDDLTRSADAAMYAAKERGGDTLQFYTMAMRVRASRRLDLERGLRGALERDELRLHYQPQVDLRTGRIAGLEALLRWQHPERGLIGPGEFIHLAEETGLIVPIGEWVLRTACAHVSAWRAAGLSGFGVAINFSARQLQERDLVGRVGRIIESSGLAPHDFECEVTESSILKNPVAVRTLLQRFGEMGLQVALDDFGTGYSSLNHLRDFPGASIKIDRSFIRNVRTDPDDAAIVRAVIEMAHNLRLRVTAEGVETAGQLAFLCAHGCDAVQGFLFSRPLRSEDVTPALLERNLLAAADDPAAEEA
ncbi:MAG TPA: EAL domain-containing protein [Geminicoccaceae bacterium]|nr:EAL domain-containing protein [Geminicoccaceae bacterium]